MLLWAPGGWGGGGGSFGPVGDVEVRMMESSHTIGVEWPMPGIGAFHLMFSCSLQDVGGFAFGASPVAEGPRH